MTPDEAINVMRRWRAQYTKKLDDAMNHKGGGYSLKLDERQFMQRQIEAIDTAIVSLSLMNGAHTDASTKETTDGNGEGSSLG